MTARLEVPHRPAPTTDPAAPGRHRPIGFAVAVAGLLAATVSFIAGLVGANVNDRTDADQVLAWSWGLNTTAFALLKIAIAVILVGIVLRLWVRIDSVRASLPALRPHVDGPAPVEVGDVATPFGAATASAVAPPALRIHTMARRLWAPMLVMGGLAVAIGFVLSLVWAARVGDGTQQAALAWTQGTQFLGEGFLLAGISLLLATILGALRQGGGEVQESLGVTVRTLKMPVTARLFMATMALGLVLSVLQFVLHGVAASVDGGTTFLSWTAWLGPTREVALGLLLAGIVLALVTIGNVLAFQFDRIRQIVATGR